MDFLKSVGSFFKVAGKGTVNIAKQVGDKTGDMIESAKVTSKITAQKAIIAKEYEKLGEYAYTKVSAGETFDVQVHTYIEAINTAKQDLEKYEEEVAKLKEIADEQNKAMKASAQQAGEALKEAADVVAQTTTQVVQSASEKVKKVVNTVKPKAQPDVQEEEKAFDEVVDDLKAKTAQAPLCPVCGTENDESVTVCAHCGELLNQMSTAEETVAMQAQPEAVTPVKETSEKPKTPKKTATKKPAAKKETTKKPATSTAKKASTKPAEKTTSEETEEPSAPVKKAPAKKTATSTAKKTTAKTATKATRAKKPATKKSTAKKPAKTAEKEPAVATQE